MKKYTKSQRRKLKKTASIQQRKDDWAKKKRKFRKIKQKKKKNMNRARKVFK